MWQYRAPRSRGEFHLFLDEEGARLFSAHLNKAASRPDTEVAARFDLIPPAQLRMSSERHRGYPEVTLIYSHKRAEPIRIEKSDGGGLRLAFDAIGRTRLVEAAQTFHDMSIPAGPKRHLWFWQSNPKSD